VALGCDVAGVTIDIVCGRGKLQGLLLQGVKMLNFNWQHRRELSGKGIQEQAKYVV